MPRTSKSRVKARARQAQLRIQLAERECRRAEKARNTAQADVRIAYVELGRALLAGEIGRALRPSRGRR
jgi:hypothetical protein